MNKKYALGDNKYASSDNKYALGDIRYSKYCYFELITQHFEGIFSLIYIYIYLNTEPLRGGFGVPTINSNQSKSNE